MNTAACHHVDRLTPKGDGNLEEQNYQSYLNDFQNSFLGVVTSCGPLFTTNVDPEALWAAYLNGFEPSTRQHHNCNACRRFIQTYGGLVAVGANGNIGPAMWDSAIAPDEYHSSVLAMSKLIVASKITGVFLSEEKVWGLPVTGVWRHFAVVPPKDRIFKHPVMNAFQAMAAKKQDHETVSRALTEFTIPLLDKAIALLEGNDLYRAEKVIGPAKWLREVQQIRVYHKGARASNLVWKKTAEAPDAFCHPRSSMVGTLLEDLAANLPFDDVKARFAAKMEPGKYGHSTVAAKPGNILAAERLIETMKAQGSLQRRYANIGELNLLWKSGGSHSPLAQAEKKPGVFAALQPKAESKPMQVDAKVVTFVKFAEAVLPKAISIKIMAPKRGHFAALTTVANLDAPPILQWDTESARNPVAWFRHVGGSEALSWGVQSGWVEVLGVCLQPSMWQEGFDHYGKGAFFLIEAKPTASGTFLFPETFRSEFRAARAVIEQFSAQDSLGDASSAACGIKLTAGEPTGILVSVATKDTVTTYHIDRWD